MDPNHSLNSHKSEDSESSCSCEDYESSDSSVCSCQYDSTYSSYHNSPQWVSTNSKLDKNILRKLSFIEELSKSYEGVNSNHVLLNKAPSWVNRKSVSDPEEPFHPKNTKSFSPKSESHTPNLSAFNSKELQQELKEIEFLLSDTNLRPPLRNSFPFRRRSSSSLSVPSNQSSLSSSPNLRPTGTTPLVPHHNSFNSYNSHFNNSNNSHNHNSHPSPPPNPNVINNWPSGFNAPKLSLQDSDYEDPEKLFSMMVSLDLFTYMYVVENVLDRKVREELVQS